MRGTRSLTLSDRFRTAPTRTELLILAVVLVALGSFIFTQGQQPPKPLSALPSSILQLAPDPISMMEVRETELSKATEGLRSDGLPLYYENPKGEPEPVGGADFKGLYLIGSYAAVALGIDDPLEAWRIIWVIAWMMVLFGGPFFISTLTSSRLAIYLTSLALLIGISTIDPLDIYWVQAWAVLALIPPVMYIWRKKSFGNRDLTALFGIALAAGVVSLIRDPAGFPVLLVAAFVIWNRSNSKPVGLGLVGLLVLGYISTSVLALEGIIALRDSQSGIDLSARNGGSSETFWHSVYIGLGYLQNDWGIYYRDEVAAAAVKSLAPDAGYHTAKYNETLREEVFRIASSEPFYIVKLLLQKTVAIFYFSFQYIFVLAVGLPALIASTFRKLLLLVTPAIVIGVLPAFLAVPTAGYLYGMIGAILLAALLGIVALLQLIGESWASSSGEGRANRIRAAAVAPFPTEHGRRLIVMYVIFLLVTAVGVTVGKRTNESHQTWTASQEKFVPIQPVLEADR